MLFFTKICIAVQSIEQERSIARWTPPPIDMCAPSRVWPFAFVVIRSGVLLSCLFVISSAAKRSREISCYLWKEKE